MKSVLWRVAKRLSCIEDARCLKVNFEQARIFRTTVVHIPVLLLTPLCLQLRDSRDICVIIIHKGSGKV